MSPTVSVIVATYNRAALLSQALGSLLTQSRPPDEIIVVSDGSTDATEAVTAAAAKTFANRLRFIRQPNSGLSRARNRGLSESQGELVWFFDDDDIALPDALEAHLGFLQTHPEVDFSYSTNYVFRGDGDIRDRGRWLLKKLPACAPEQFLVRTLMGMHTMIPGMLIPRRCYDLVGGFDEQLSRAQDLDMLIRLARRFRAADICRPTFVLRDHNGDRGPAAERHSHAQRARVWLQYRQRIFRQVRRNLPLTVFLRSEGDRSVSGELRREDRLRALTRRFCIMFREGLVTEALEDLDTALALAPVNAPAWAERTFLAKATNIEGWKLAAPWSTGRALRARLATAPTAAWRRELLRGARWSIGRALRDYRWHDAARTSCFIGALLVNGFVHRQRPRGKAGNNALSYGHNDKRGPRRPDRAEQELKNTRSLP